MAAPMVTGTVALVEAAHPTWSMQQVIDAVLDHTTPDPNLAGRVSTGGIVNAAAAVANTSGPRVTAASLSGAIAGASSLSTLQLTFNEEINPATFTPSQVTLTGPHGTISGITVVPSSNNHQFTISFSSQTAAGTYTLKVGPNVQDWYGNAMNQNGNLVNGEASDAFADTMYLTATGSSDLLSVTSFPTTTTAGTAQTITITALSPSGSVDTSFTGTVHFSSSDAKAILPANYTFTASNNGTYTFTTAATLVTQGAQSITVTNTANPAIAGAEEDIWVTGATAHSLLIGGLPSSETAGTPFNFTVTALDQYGNLASGYAGTVAFTSTDSHAVLPSSYSFLAGNQGTFSFTATLKTAGTQTITATDSTDGLSATSSAVTVQPAVAAVLAVTGFPNPDPVGTANNFTVAAYDAYGNLATGYAGTVRFNSSDPKATLPASYTFSSSDAGKHTFSATLATGGTQSITATDTSTSSITGSESGITVQSVATQSFQVTGFPTTVAAGASYSVTVTAYNGFGNIATGYTGTVHFTSSDGQAVLPANYTFSSGNAGTHTFTVTLETAGTQSITVTDTSTSTITGTESAIAVQPAAASTLKLTGLPNPAALGTANSFVVTAYDPYGNVATGYTGTVAFTSTDPLAKLPASYKFTAANAGTSTFSATLNTVGAQSITATDQATSSITGSQSVTVSSTTATFLKTDTTTQGNWIGVYGSQGYNIIGNGSSYPSYATVTPSGQANCTWVASTTDSRALQDVGGSGRIAACWYSGTSFTINVDLTDGQAHDVALYALDWDRNGRSEQIQITNASTGAVLDTEKISSFSGGEYLQWNISGDVVIKLTNLAGVNAVISGLFFDPTSSPVNPPPPSPTPVAAASFVRSDTTTQGNWIGVYGSQGYNIIGNGSSYPSYATVTPSGQANCTWVASTTDSRALQDVGGSGRIAACWYSGTSFSINVDLTDGQAHDLALYALDWDRNGRSEQIQITNASTGAVLDTETISSFSGGEYLQWNISGDVVIKLTNLAGCNAVISGLFFDPTSSPVNPPPPSPTPVAATSFVRSDTTTQGNWIGVYGSQGYNIIGNGSSYPSYATVTPSGQANCTWVASTTDSRALQDVGGSGRIAACWYSGTSFSINVDLTDGQAHDVTLYALDWDRNGRSEQIQITNASTGAVLDTETISSFSGGEYLQWNISGDVVIKLTNLAGCNAVISGLFFDPPTAGSTTAAVSSIKANVAAQALGAPATVTPTDSELGTVSFLSSDNQMVAPGGFALSPADTTATTWMGRRRPR
jgi:transcriptional antiterminator Rof (Rho-off)